ncbi:hypothetical protein [Aminobacter niigataensis]|uniref:hypothetical protein n=1 Tax=Aminobacter niigataensis TaxID=83265 RepID=UPI0024CAE1BA|nr:hypothetical protein [Aminobacter niigataensis]CAI2931893.1 conserved protein of unknown function [Aminobacter niigataensis]
MCDPFTIAGVALTAGSTLANSIAQRKVANARNDVMAAERIRQNGLDQQADALNVQSQDRYQNFDDQQADKASELGQYFTDQQIEAGNANAAVTQEMNVPQSGSNITVREEQKQRGQARDFADSQGKALGVLRAFGDVIGETGRGQVRDAMGIGQIGRAKQGSSNVVPFELEAANSAGDGAKLFGDLLNLGGTYAFGEGARRNVFPEAPKLKVDPWKHNGLDLRMTGRQDNSLYRLYGDKVGLF